MFLNTAKLHDVDTSLVTTDLTRMSGQVKSCDKRVQTPGMSPPRAGAWTYYREKLQNCTQGAIK